MNTELHKAQASILYSLRHSTSARFSDLRQPTGMDSDAFKFHIRKMLQLAYIEKLPTGAYTLTTRGKEYANNLAESGRATQKQPKLSVLIVAMSRSDQDEPLFLMQQRLRNPFYGHWGLLTGPVGWGEDIEEAARRELLKQTGLRAAFAVRMFYRKKDHANDTNVLLEDKLFAVVEATDVTGTLNHNWDKGVNNWLSLEQLEKQDRYFADTSHVINALQNNESYIVVKNECEIADY